MFTSILYGSSATYGSTTLNRAVVTNTRAIVVAKVSSAGAVTDAYIAADGDVWGGSLVVDNSGSVYLSGTFSGTSVLLGTSKSAVGSSDAFVMKISSANTLQWVRAIGNIHTTYYSLVGLARGGGVILNMDNAGSSTVTIGTIIKQLDDLDSLVIHIPADGTLP
jgi:hypothetical protein